MQRPISEGVFHFTVVLAESARLFSTRQIARHPDLSWRTNPIKRASETLLPYARSFEKHKGIVGEPVIWRLSQYERRKRGITYKQISPRSSKVFHWLTIGDVWCALTFTGGRPTKWIAEPQQEFDIACEWQNQWLLIEVQCTPITTKKWREKWERRRAWYTKQDWSQKPLVVLVNLTNQQDETIQIPPRTLHVRSVDELPMKVMRWKS